MYLEDQTTIPKPCSTYQERETANLKARKERLEEYQALQEPALPTPLHTMDPTVGLWLGLYGGRRGVGVFTRRGGSGSERIRSS